MLQLGRRRLTVSRDALPKSICTPQLGRSLAHPAGPGLLRCNGRRPALGRYAVQPGRAAGNEPWRRSAESLAAGGIQSGLDPGVA